MNYAQLKEIQKKLSEKGHETELVYSLNGDYELWDMRSNIPMKLHIKEVK